jgi:uracil-DNA glycosylase family 4
MPSASSASDPRALLCSDIEQEARRAPFDVCGETYAAAGRDPAVPIVSAGSLDAPVCCFGRELGREEVHEGQPLIGSGGRRLRRVVHETVIGPAAKTERRFDAVLDHVFLTNMVPYRPVGNRAYDKRTVDRFRPFVEQLLGSIWSGERIVALGQNAFLWFVPYAPDDAVRAAWADREHRFDATLQVAIGGRAMELCCVPHPSPLSPFKAQFATLLGGRLRG